MKIFKRRNKSLIEAARKLLSKFMEKQHALEIERDTLKAYIDLRESFTTADDIQEKRNRYEACNEKIEIFKNVIKQLTKTRKTVDDVYNHYDYYF